MPVRIDSSRFGALQIDESEVIEFPLGLAGLSGSRYALVSGRGAATEHGGVFRWLHSLEDPALALPVVDPRRFFPAFVLEIAPEDGVRTGLRDLAAARLYVTVRASPDPAAITVNLRAPLVILANAGYQVINTAPGAELRTPLFDPPAAPARPRSDAA